MGESPLNAPLALGNRMDKSARNSRRRPQEFLPHVSDYPRGRHLLDRLARPASSYGVDAATYLAIVTGEMAGVGLDRAALRLLLLRADIAARAAGLWVAINRRRGVTSRCAMGLWARCGASSRCCSIPVCLRRCVCCEI